MAAGHVEPGDPFLKQQRAQKGCNDPRQGQTIIIFALAILPLFGMMGLVVDIGWAYFRQEAAQTAADAAANAAASAAFTAGAGSTPTCATTGVSCYSTPYSCPTTISTPPANNILAGCLYAKSNGFTTAGRQTVTFLSGTGNAPGVSGAATGFWVTAKVTEQIPQMFSAVLGFANATVAAKATGGVTVAGASACIYVLSPTASPAVNVNGSSSITLSQCGMYINSSGSAALTVTGASHVTGTVIDINGTGVSITGSSGTTPSPTLNAGAVTDPLASLPAPSYSGCDHTNYSISNGNSATLSPGVYCGGITMGYAHVTLNAGTYILNGGGLTLNNSGDITGSGVTFYNTGSAGHTAAPVTINGGVVANLSAPTSGTYKGVVFFQDRTLTYSSPNTVANGASGVITGSFYFPTTEFDYAGSASAAVYEAFIVKTLSVTGSSTLKYDSSGTYTGLSGLPGSGAARAVLIQ